MLKRFYVPSGMFGYVSGFQKTQSRFPVTARMYCNDGRKGIVPANAKYVGRKSGIHTWETDTDIYSVTAPYQIGDILYVCESVKRICATKTLWLEGNPVSTEEFFGWKYRFDSTVKFDEGVDPIAEADEFHTVDITEERRWRTPLTMPAEAANLYLRVVNVEVERLQDISPADITQEGIKTRHDIAYMRFRNYWNDKVQNRSYCAKWERNPWVWKITYEVTKGDTPFRESVSMMYHVVNSS